MELWCGVSAGGVGVGAHGPLIKSESLGVAQAIDGLGNPFSSCGIQPLTSLFLFVACGLHSARFVYPSNTVLTPREGSRTGLGVMAPGRVNSRLNPTSGLAHNLCSTKFSRMKKAYDYCVIRTHDPCPKYHAALSATQGAIQQ